MRKTGKEGLLSEVKNLEKCVSIGMTTKSIKVIDVLTHKIAGAKTEEKEKGVPSPGGEREGQQRRIGLWV